MRARGRALWLSLLALGAGHAVGQELVYVEPGRAACPAAPAPQAARTATRGVPQPGSLRVTCGFEQGSYTVTLTATDPAASFSPNSFIVNFGRLVGNGRFTVRFATPGLQRVSAAITSNMGSPAVHGQFVSAAGAFDVVPP